MLSERNRSVALSTFSLIMNKILRLLMILPVVFWAACFDQREDPGPVLFTGPGDRLDAAGIYLCDQFIENGIVRHRLVEILRHEPRLGDTPQVGDDLSQRPPNYAAADANYGNQAIVYKFHLIKEEKNVSAYGEIRDSVEAGWIYSLNMDLDAFRQMVRQDPTER